MREALERLKKPQILDIFKALNNGSIGFDDARVGKDECIDRLIRQYTEEQISQAMAGDGDDLLKGDSGATGTIAASHNAQWGLMLRFDSKPSEHCRDLMKAGKMRWTKDGQFWYAGKNQVGELRLQAIYDAHNAGNVSATVLSIASLPVTPEPTTPVTPEPTTPATDSSDQAARDLGRILRDLAGGIDESAVEAIAQRVVDRAFSPTVVHVQPPAPAPARDLGLQHMAFPQLFQAAQARTDDGHHINIWLVGPMGTGKTTAARNLAAALDLEFFAYAALRDAFDISGYKDAGGQYQRTMFREAYEHGGVCLLDEADASAPAAMVALNNALANDRYGFPDGMIERHTDFLCIVGANTYGTGGTADYNARHKQDSALLDRFTPIAWDIDETLEIAMTTNKAWAKRVQAVRKRVIKRGVKGVTISPRATIYGAALLAAGMDQDQVETMTLRKGMTADTWEAVQ